MGFGGAVFLRFSSALPFLNCGIDQLVDYETHILRAGGSSPPPAPMTYFVDIDNTICLTEGNDYETSTPIMLNIQKINELFDKGHNVIYWTARGSSSGKDWYFLTIKQLNQWGCKYNSLITGKPSYDFLIDDKALNIDSL